MDAKSVTREEMWAMQQMREEDVDYSVWDKDREMLCRMAAKSRNCTFVVDVYKCRYAFASLNFVDILGYDRRKIETLERQGDYLESRIHPDDIPQLEALQVYNSKFIYSLPEDQRNDYSNIYSFRMLNAKRQYVRVISRQQVLESDGVGKAWLILGNMEISPDQKEKTRVDCTVLNQRNGEMFFPNVDMIPSVKLTLREIEVLRLVREGLQSKEIAERLHISVCTVNIHRQNMMRKLGVQNSMEAVRVGMDINIL